MAVYPQRLTVNRGNPYVKPLGYLKLGAGGLESFETSQCVSGINAIYREWNELTPTEQANFTRLDQPGPGARTSTTASTSSPFLNQRNSNDLPAPPCKQQGTYSAARPDRAAADPLPARLQAAVSVVCASGLGGTRTGIAPSHRNFSASGAI